MKVEQNDTDNVKMRESLEEQIESQKSVIDKLQKNERQLFGKVKALEKKSTYSFFNDLQGKISGIQSESKEIQKIHEREVKAQQESVALKEELQKVRQSQPELN